MRSPLLRPPTTERERVQDARVSVQKGQRFRDGYATSGVTGPRNHATSGVIWASPFQTERNLPSALLLMVDLFRLRP
jgi:hypothetical protein